MKAAADATQARDLLVEKILNARGGQNGATYWGQFLDDSRQHDQRGVYGTTAAIELLSEHGYGADQEPIKTAIEGLPLIGTGTAYRSHDQNLVFKVAAIVHACGMTSGTLDLSHPAASRLIEMRVDDRGWGGYSSPADHDTTPSIVATSVALFALSVAPTWSVDSRCRTSLVWLSQRLEAGNTGEIEDSVGLLALRLYRSIGDQLPQWRAGVKAAERRVLVRVRRKASKPDIRRIHYPVTLDGQNDNRYMYYSPAIIGALAFLTGDAHKRVRGGPHVTQLVRTLAKKVTRDRAFRWDDRVATVDQLWVDRLFKAFIDTSKSPNRFLQPFGRIISSRKFRWIAAPVLLAVVVVGSLLAGGKSVKPLYDIVTLVGALVVGLIANAISSRGED
jgi:hypothetical protein